MGSPLGHSRWSLCSTRLSCRFIRSLIISSDCSNRSHRHCAKADDPARGVAAAHAERHSPSAHVLKRRVAVGGHRRLVDPGVGDAMPEMDPATSRRCEREEEIALLPQDARVIRPRVCDAQFLGSDDGSRNRCDCGSGRNVAPKSRIPLLFSISRCLSTELTQGQRAGTSWRMAMEVADRTFSANGRSGRRLCQNRPALMMVQFSMRSRGEEGMGCAQCCVGASQCAAGRRRRGADGRPGSGRHGWAGLSDGAPSIACVLHLLSGCPVPTPQRAVRPLPGRSTGPAQTRSDTRCRLSPWDAVSTGGSSTRLRHGGLVAARRRDAVDRVW